MERSWEGSEAEKREEEDGREPAVELAERVEEEGREDSFMGTIALEKVTNPVGKGTGITAFSESTDLSGSVGAGRINNEPVEISWDLDPG